MPRESDAVTMPKLHQTMPNFVELQPALLGSMAEPSSDLGIV
jgi:hypothetical protein